LRRFAKSPPRSEPDPPHARLVISPPGFPRSRARAVPLPHDSESDSPRCPPQKPRGCIGFHLISTTRFACGVDGKSTSRVKKIDTRLPPALATRGFTGSLIALAPAAPLAFRRAIGHLLRLSGPTLRASMAATGLPRPGHDHRGGGSPRGTEPLLALAGALHTRLTADGLGHRVRIPADGETIAR